MGRRCIRKCRNSYRSENILIKCINNKNKSNIKYIMILENLSNFNNTKDYLPIITSALIVDLFVIILAVFNIIKIKSLNTWYKKFSLSAVLADVLSIVIGIIIARYLYPFIFKEYSLLKFLFLTVIVQLTHDLLFALFFNSIPRDKSSILDIFKDYVLEVGIKILLVDALMMISTIIIASYLSKYSQNGLIIIFIIMLYITPYLLYSIK
jgi:hypothetical protein